MPDISREHLRRRQAAGTPEGEAYLAELAARKLQKRLALAGAPQGEQRRKTQKSPSKRNRTAPRSVRNSQLEGESLADLGAGLTQLDPRRPPRDVPRKHWQQLIEDCARLRADGVFEKAISLGWNLVDLLGADSSRPFARIDAMGLAWLVTDWRVIIISEDAAILRAPTGSLQTYRRKPGAAGRVLAWELIEGDQANGHHI